MNALTREIHSLLNTEKLAENLKPLFCHVLRWGAPAGIAQRSVPGGTSVGVSLVLQPVAQISGLPVFWVDWPEFRLPGKIDRRTVQRALKPTYAEHLVCYITKDKKQAAFVWAKKRSDNNIEIRALPYEVGSPARTTLEQLAKLAFTLEELGSTGQPPITTVTDKLNAAFSVEAVTKRFFEDYKKVFDDLQKRLLNASGDKEWAHDYALQLLNRLMFLYFIQRKRWLAGDSNFIGQFWKEYKNSGQPQDTFYKNWLSILFFEAFNQKFHGGYKQFPDRIRSALQMAPYLNGGLFTQNQLDGEYDPKLSDEFFAMLFDHFDGTSPGFLERYNFTIAESTPLDIEVAVDPEMIGKVYESLVNITFEGLTEEDLRGSAGIFYTPRVEIDLMCRLSLVDALANNLGDDKKLLLYDAVFANESADKDAADQALASQNLWPKLAQLLREITVCDPACGSGSFLVGMLLLLDDLQARANTQLGVEETPYERRRRIIGEQLYGVDVMSWAVHVAELRLWLQLVVETELEPAELQFRPLLPNLSFKVRQGDSLLQEVGGVNLGLHRHHLDIPSSLKGRITQLKGKKLRFYQGEAKLSESEIQQEELQIFQDVLLHKMQGLQQKLVQTNAKLATTAHLPGMERQQNKAIGKRAEWEASREELEANLSQIAEAARALNTARNIPFVWELAFVEIFEGDKGGFDIVIGNPPYVRQEKIAPPTLDPNQFGGEDTNEWREQKRTYKTKLQESVAVAYPKFFGYTPGKPPRRSPDGKSDLYIYFYLHGLSLVNHKGSFCFITSNSWLDVGYGKDLQEFLLRHSHVKFILDNDKKRSFSQADVNTTIALLAPPDERTDVGLDKTARFVMFKVPFEEVLNAENFKALEAATDRQSTERWLISVLSQRDLLEEGLVREEDEQATETAKPGKSHAPLIKTARYEANKWGGKYLRAPDIFFTILEKGKGKLVRLGDIAEVRFGIKTGANDFFYLEPTGKPAPKGYVHVRNGAGWEGELEEEFLKPVIKSPRECRSIVIKPEDLRYKIFMCHKDKGELKGTNALEYIKWGETQKFHLRPSCRGRQRWWDLGKRDFAKVLWPMIHNDRHCAFWNGEGVVVDHNLFEILCDFPFEAWAFLASTAQLLFRELFGRSNLGEGALKTEGIDISRFYLMKPAAFSQPQDRQLRQAFHTLSRRETFNLEIEVRQPDRRALDEVVFDVLGLTAGEREAVYEAVVELVRRRLEKARSV